MSQANSSTDAYVERFTVEPTSVDGPLAGLTCSVKDLIDVKGYRTGCGNPTWLSTVGKTPAASHACCVEGVLQAGASINGKTVTDELAFSLDGENFFFGTPLNPAYPEGIPGGSSSGSASAVAQGLCDFSLGTDTGGSVRVPAALCGIVGLRPTHGLISLAGVMPFSPTYDVVGFFTRDLATCIRVADAILPRDRVKVNSSTTRISVLREAWDLASSEVRSALASSTSAPLNVLKSSHSVEISEATCASISGIQEDTLSRWLKVFEDVQWGEIWSSLGTWVEAYSPAFGPRAQGNFSGAQSRPRDNFRASWLAVHELRRQLDEFLADGRVICIPTCADVPPRKRVLVTDGQAAGRFYGSTLLLTCIAGIGGLPQVTIPFRTADGLPCGLSFIGQAGSDHSLLRMCHRLLSASVK
jgi:amidase